MPCQLQVVAGIILAASPRCFPYTIAKSAMRDTAVGIWSALERGNRGQHRPGWAPRVRQGAILTTGLVRTLLGHQLSSRWTPVHKPSSNSGNPVAWFTDSATKSCLLMYCINASRGQGHGCRFTMCHASLKMTLLLHTEGLVKTALASTVNLEKHATPGVHGVLPLHVK